MIADKLQLKDEVGSELNQIFPESTYILSIDRNYECLVKLGRLTIEEVKVFISREIDEFIKIERKTNEITINIKKEVK